MDEKKIKEQFDRLPQILKDAAHSDTTKAVIKEIADACNFDSDGMVDLENATLSIVLGILHPQDFVAEIKKIEGTEDMDSDEVRAIAQEINRRVFRPVRDELKKLHGIDDVAEIQNSIPEDERMPIDKEGSSVEGIGDSQEIPAPYALNPIPSYRPKPLDAELQSGVGLRPPEPPRFEPPRKPLDAELSESMRKPPLPPSPSAPTWDRPSSQFAVSQTEPAATLETNLPENPWQALSSKPSAPSSPVPPAVARSAPAFEPPRPQSFAEPQPPRSETYQKPAYTQPPSLPGETDSLPSAWQRPAAAWNEPPRPGLREFTKPQGEGYGNKGTGDRVQGIGGREEKNTRPMPAPTPYALHPIPSSALSPSSSRHYVNPFAEHQEPEENLNREEILKGIENPSSIPASQRPNFNQPIREPPKQYGTDPYREQLK